MEETRICWVCDKEKSLTEMVFAADGYICDTKECLVEAVEQLYQTTTSLTACK